MITLTTVLKHVDSVKPEEIGRCHKIIARSGNFYMVLSESDNLTEYKVTWDKEHGFRCTCPAGQEGFAHCSRGFCKHVLWSVGCSQEEKQAMAELNMAQAKEQAQKQTTDLYMTINGQQVSQQTIQALMNRKPAPVGNGRGYQSKGFSILK